MSSSFYSPSDSQSSANSGNCSSFFQDTNPTPGVVETLYTLINKAEVIAVAASVSAKASADLITTLLTPQTASATLTLPATVGASAAALLVNTTSNLLCVHVLATTAASAINYILTLYDGDPSHAGKIIYQATGITLASYSDSASFFITAPSSGSIWSQVTNIDADATTLVVALTYMGLL